MPKRIPIYQVDAFTQHVFGGNPAAVCPLDAWLDDRELQAIAAENNLSETAYVVDEAERLHIRWFTPQLEVDLCGHATLATAHVLYEHLAYQSPQLTFQSLSGPLTITRAPRGYTMDFPVWNPVRIEPSANLLAAWDEPPLEVYRAHTYLLLVYEQEATIRAAAPDFQKLKEENALGVIITAPGEQVDMVSRFFAPRAGIDEDPVTGSAHCALTPYWSQRLNKTRLHALQISARGGELHCELKGERVLLTGQAVTYLQGTLRI